MVKFDIKKKTKEIHFTKYIKKKNVFNIYRSSQNLIFFIKLNLQNKYVLKVILKAVVNYVLFTHRVGLPSEWVTILCAEFGCSVYRYPMD